jgi:DNA-binding protein Fis
MADGANGRGDGTAEFQTATRALADTVPLLVERLSRARPGQIYRQALELLERPLLAHVLAMTGGNQLRAARLLGLNRNTLRKRCRELHLALPREPKRGAAEKGPSASLAPSAARSPY